MASATRTLAACLLDAMHGEPLTDMERLAIMAGREPIDAPKPLECHVHKSGTPRLVREARLQMGEARWAELNAEWE